LNNPNPIEWSRLIDWIRSLGYPLRKMSFERWRDLTLFAGRSRPDDLLPLLPFLPAPDSTRILDGFETPRIDCRKTLDGLKGSSIACAPADAALLDVYFAYFIRSGHLAPPPGAVPDKTVSGERHS
jgi:hypothetical protein